MREKHPKLYGLITQYLSNESHDKIMRQDDFEKIDKATDRRTLETSGRDTQNQFN